MAVWKTTFLLVLSAISTMPCRAMIGSFYLYGFMSDLSDHIAFVYEMIMDLIVILGCFLQRSLRSGPAQSN